MNYIPPINVGPEFKKKLKDGKIKIEKIKTPRMVT